jgi:hypothetical protein
MHGFRWIEPKIAASLSRVTMLKMRRLFLSTLAGA